MTDLENFNKVWNGYFQKVKDGSGAYTDRGFETKMRYENILFSIWKHHQDWEEEDGFQLKCNYEGNPNMGALYRVRRLAERAGLLIKVGNYYVGDHTNYYKKNHILFDLAFRGVDNQYGKWLERSKNDIELDIIYKTLIDEFSKLNKSNNYSIYNNIPNLDTKTTRSRKSKPLNYDLEKLYKLTETLFPYYYDLMIKLNNAVHHHELKFVSFLYFNKKGLPAGRPYSSFCSTLNPNKTHKDNSGELRPDFLKRIGLPDYYEVYDIKSEVPRINWLFHTGEWKPDNYDFYEKIIDDFHIRMPDSDGDRVSRGKAGSKNYNDSMKQIFMRAYFGRGSETQSFFGYKNEYMERNKNNWENIKKVFPKFKKEDFYAYTFDEWYELSCSTEKICGKSIGALIFWFAFFIQTETKIELLKRGKKVYNVYDGFYFNQDISDEIRAILKEKAEAVCKNYMIQLRLQA